MSRFLAQLLSPLFLALGAGGFLLGDASTPGKGDLGPLDLDLTPARDVADLGLLVLFVLIGFVLSRHLGRRLMALAGVALVALGVLGLAKGEAGALGMRFAIAMNVFDLAAGALVLLAAAGTIEEPEPPQGSFLRGG
ncbi:MAG TPA: hypothetical protein VFC09_16410 [Candidatus Dormibacteraeota bacterium]|nr:hypothetical protein [Candidatus Dormibacteraeota bacterium]